MHQMPSVIVRLMHSSIGLLLALVGVHAIIARRWLHDQRIKSLKKMGYPDSELMCSESEIKHYLLYTVLCGAVFIAVGTFIAVGSWIS